MIYGCVLDFCAGVKRHEASGSKSYFETSNSTGSDLFLFVLLVFYYMFQMVITKFMSRCELGN